MANPEHLEILKQGVDFWNRWRWENPEIEPDLSRGQLIRRKLHRVDLSRTDLTKATFCIDSHLVVLCNESSNLLPLLHT